MSVINLSDLDLSSKKVLIRQDLNVPIKDGVVTSDKRIKASVPTIQMAMKQGAKVLLMSTPASQFFSKRTVTPKISVNRSATGCNVNSSLYSPSVGRPR